MSEYKHKVGRPGKADTVRAKAAEDKLGVAKFNHYVTLREAEVRVAEFREQLTGEAEAALIEAIDEYVLSGGSVSGLGRGLDLHWYRAREAFNESVRRSGGVSDTGEDGEPQNSLYTFQSVSFPSTLFPDSPEVEYSADDGVSHYLTPVAGGRYALDGSIVEPEEVADIVKAARLYALRAGAS